MSAKKDIRQKADLLGIHKLGIIKLEAMLDYEDRLRERMDRIPNGEAIYSRLLPFADVKRGFPWARSLVVAALHYGHYAIPQEASGRFGKAYLMDQRFNPESPERQKIIALEDYMRELGIRAERNEHPGITAMRWAAYKAGLGTIRRNNFFYTELGSWLSITAWAIDAEMELISSPSLPECPTNCDRCIHACPVNSLSCAYTMNMATCISRITTSNENAPADDSTNEKIGRWIYGCDICQDVCPMNAGKWNAVDSFPGLDELGELLSPGKILGMSYEEIEHTLARKFFYIKKEFLWKWKLNAINSIVNDAARDVEPGLRRALSDENEFVRERARRALGKLGL
jgi:epoxyqueuosine reductase